MNFPIELNGQPVTTAKVVYPAYGVGSFCVTMPLASELAAGAGALLLKYDDLEVRGTLLQTYPLTTGIEAWCIFGYGGWRKELPAKSYQSSAGVRLDTVLTDFERETGEKFDAKPSLQLGSHWVRHKGVASRSLTLATVAWRIKPDGNTTLSGWADSKVSERFDVVGLDEPRGVYDLASSSMTQFLPGATFQSSVMPTPRKAQSVEHNLSNGEARATVWV